MSKFLKKRDKLFGALPESDNEKCDNNTPKVRKIKTDFQVKPPSAYGLKEYNDLKPSLITNMAYIGSDIIFDLDKIYNELPIITEEFQGMEIPLTKKGKIDKKGIRAPYGSIISIQKGSFIRGAKLKKPGKEWCTVCKPYYIKSNGDREKKNTIVEIFVDDPNVKNLCEIKFYCKSCDKTFSRREIKKVNHFLNQVTINIFLENNLLLNIMFFKNSIKIANCKNELDDSVEILMILFQEYLDESFLIKKSIDGKLNCIIETVMRNVDFKLGFDIDRVKLSKLLNKKNFKDKVSECLYEPGDQSNVNIKMYNKIPENYKFNHAVFDFKTKEFKLTKYDGIPDFLEPKHTKTLQKFKSITFIVFCSSEIILSSRYRQTTVDLYNFFISLLFENKDYITEKIVIPSRNDILKITNDFSICHLQNKIKN
jgi:hypothetical protein